MVNEEDHAVLTNTLLYGETRKLKQSPTIPDRNDETRMTHQERHQQSLAQQQQQGDDLYDEIMYEENVNQEEEAPWLQKDDEVISDTVPYGAETLNQETTATMTTTQQTVS
jgi:hypothetical protein